MKQKEIPKISRCRLSLNVRLWLQQGAGQSQQLRSSLPTADTPQTENPKDPGRPPRKGVRLT